MAFSDDRETTTATITAAGSLSAAVPLGGKALIGIMMAATASGDFDANTVSLQFNVSMDGTTYEILRDNDGSLIKVVVAQNNTLGATHLSPDKFAPWRFVKISTHKADEAVQAQTAKTTFTLITAKITG